MHGAHRHPHAHRPAFAYAGGSCGHGPGRHGGPGEGPEPRGRGWRAFAGPGGFGKFGGPGGFGPGGAFGFGFGPGGPGGPRGRGRRRRGDVRIAALLLLSEEPRNGYGLMQAIEERSGGRWRPSPGAVYPALAQLEDEGLIRSVESDSGKVLEITDTGRAALAERGEIPAPWESDPDEAGHEELHDLKRLMGETAAAAWQIAMTGDPAKVAQARERLAEARRALYLILAGEEA